MIAIDDCPDEGEGWADRVREAENLAIGALDKLSKNLCGACGQKFVDSGHGVYHDHADLDAIQFSFNTVQSRYNILVRRINEILDSVDPEDSSEWIEALAKIGELTNPHKKDDHAL